MTLVVVAVAQQNDRPAYRPVVLRLHELVTAGKIECVIHRGAAARSQRAHSDREFFRVVGKILRDLRSHIEAYDESLVVPGTYRLIQKFRGRFLLELETVAHRIAGIDQQSYFQR